MPTRRNFLHSTSMGLGALASLSLLRGMPALSAKEVRSTNSVVRMDSSIEPLVKLIENQPREKLLEEVGQRIMKGLSYQQTLAALFLAGVRNIQPRPIGFKFHAVLVVHSAHQASLASPDGDRWLPLFWALDYFKDSQARNKREGDWHLPAIEEARIPKADKALPAFTEAMDKWDAAAVDPAIAALSRNVGSNRLFDLFCRYGCRDFREIGHKIIYVANSWRMLQTIGWQHSEPVLRSLAYGLLDYHGENPARTSQAADRPYQRNIRLVDDIRAGWTEGRRDAEASTEMLATLRHGSDEDASEKVVELLNKEVSPESIFDAFHLAAGEFLMQTPGIISLHAVTSANAFHYAFKACGDDQTRRLLMLQNAAFLPLFRGPPRKSDIQIDKLIPSAKPPSLDELLAGISTNNSRAAQDFLAARKAGLDATEFIDAARRLLFMKGNDAHDYKFAGAVLEDYHHISPTLRDQYLASSVYHLHGPSDPDNQLIKRIRGALV